MPNIGGKIGDASDSLGKAAEAWEKAYTKVPEISFNIAGEAVKHLGGYVVPAVTIAAGDWARNSATDVAVKLYNGDNAWVFDNAKTCTIERWGGFGLMTMAAFVGLGMEITGIIKGAQRLTADIKNGVAKA